MNRLVALSLGILSAYIASAASVVVRQRMVVDGVATELSEEVMVVGTEHSTMAPKTINGYIFTHWTISTEQVFAARDEWGRAYDRPTFKVAEKSTLTAWYVSATEDSDGDGVADGHEMYWYGNLEQNGASDTDGDGFSFALELANGTNPHMMETEVTGPIIGALGEEVVYNAAGYKHVVVRSEPEGTLLATSEDWVRPGATITTAGYSPSNSKFVYWTMNGVPQRDGFGRALDSVSFIMGDEDVELVAATVEDAEMRQKLYWYGDVAVAMTSDTDGDGFTFAQEIANGTNPLMAETEVEGPITYALGEEVVVHSADCRRVVIRSAPDDAMTASSEEWVRTGATITTPSYSPNNSKFVYWTINGVVQRDAFGRALDQVSITVGNEDVELVAATVDDDEMRMKLYWYGDVAVSMMSDTDGDGFTFAQEIANGTNPLMAESEVEGPITVASGTQIIYDPYRREIWYGDFDYDFTAATQWDGYVVDEAEAIVGVVSVTVGTPNRLTGLSRITAKVQLADGKRRVQIFKGYMNSGTFVSDDCRFGLELGKNAMNGFVDDYLIYGARNQFKAKDIESRNFALAAGKRCAGAYTLAVEQDGGFSTFMITVKSQGWVGIRGTLADGTTISGSSRLLLGECECLIPLSLSRNGKSLSGLIWFGEDGAIECTNFHGDVDSIVLVGDSQEGFKLKSNSFFKIDVGQLGEMIGPGLLEELVPNGMPISMTGTKFILPRTGRVVIDKSTGGVDASKLGDNPAGLRLTCSAKTGLVTGRFNVYQFVNGKVKSISVVIRGVMLNGEVYGMGKISGAKSLPIVIER